MDKDRSETATKIMDVAQELIQTRGYNAISFNHIAERVGIRKPSIVHHFPSKEALGQAVVQRYRENFSAALDGIAGDSAKTALQAFDFYCGPYLDFATVREKICLCGALAGEFMALPEEVQKEVTRFFKDHLKWLEDILRRGLTNGEFSFTGDPAVKALLILDALQGSLIVKRATGDTDQVAKVASALKENILSGN